MVYNYGVIVITPVCRVLLLFPALSVSKILSVVVSSAPFPNKNRGLSFKR